MAALTCGAATDIGRVRKMNQDSMAILTSADLNGRADGLYVVADGMGGRAGGEIASRVTVQTVPDVVREALEEGGDDEGSLANALSEGMVAANRAVWMQSRANPELRGMGTTCVAVLVRESTAAIGNVGDSRIYLLRGGAIRQITSDHSLVQEHVMAGDISATEARSSRYRNVITRAIGITDDVAPDVDLLKLQPGDTLLLCSDGLTNMVEDREIGSVLAGVGDAQQAAEALVTVANANGGHDNITAVVVRHGDFTPIEVPIPDELDETETLRERYEAAAKPASSRMGWFLPLALLVVGLTGLALWIVNRTPAPHTVAPANPANVAPRPAGPPPPRLQYGEPETLSKIKLRGEPLACDAAGNVYALTPAGQVQRIGGGRTAGYHFGTRLRVLDPVSDVHWASDADGNLYVSYRKDGRIDKFDSHGTRIATLPRTGTLIGPEGIAVDGSQNIYVVDGGTLKVLRAQAGTPSRREASHGPR